MPRTRPRRRLPRAGPARQARPPQALRRLRRGRGQDLPHAGGGARAAAARRRRGAGLRRDARPRRDRGADRRAGDRPAQADRVPRRVVEEMDLEAVLARKPAGGHRRRDSPTPTRPARATASATRTCSSSSTPASTSSAPSTSSTSSGSTICRARHRRRGARDRAGQLPQAGRPGGEPGPRGRGPAGAAAGREDLRARQGAAGRSRTSSRTRTSPPCASWRCARWRRAWTAPASAQRRSRTQTAAGRPAA